MNPGPVVAATVNLTALSTQQAGLLALPADVSGLQEVRLDEPGQQEYKIKMRDAGLDIIFGAPLVRKTFTSRIPAGGVAIAARPELGLRCIPPKCDLSKQLYASTRFVHGVVRFQDCVVHVISLYGFTNAARGPNQRKKNEELLQMLFHFLASLGDVPIIVLGDFNVAPQQSITLTTMLGSGDFFDLAEVQSRVTGRPQK